MNQLNNDICVFDAFYDKKKTINTFKFKYFCLVHIRYLINYSSTLKSNSKKKVMNTPDVKINLTI